MKIKDLKNAPEWLREAKVRNEDVEIIDDVVIWKDGIWEDGIWKDGIWERGIWERGTWRRGIWERGTWEDGIWRCGIWERGTWRGGFKSIGHCRWAVYYSTEGIIKIGCETKTLEDWDKWFAGDEEFETKRNTPEFLKIKNSYELAKMAIKLKL